MQKDKLLIVDDEKEIADLISLYLNNEGFQVFTFYNATDALQCIQTEDLDLAILDIMLPDISGFTLCREKHRYPIIMLTAKGEGMDKITGLSLGADDYMTKPFGVMELISRVKALLRRTEGLTESAVLKNGEITVDTEKRKVMVSGEPCELTYKEFELLKMMLLNAGIVLSRDKIMDQVWGFDYEGESRTVDMHIKTLRQKLGKGGSAIKTVRNVGYVMDHL